MKKKFTFILWVLLLAIFCNSCHSKQYKSLNALMDSSSEDSSPNIGLALGGGGAKAAAHIEVLRFLDKENIKIDYLAGSSMGAFVGGLYAAGYTPHQIDSLWQHEDWIKLFDKYSIGTLRGDRTFIGLVKGEVLEKNLRQLLEKKGCKKIKDTKTKTNIQFTCTATEIINNKDLKKYVFGPDDDMAKAIRISMAYPAPGAYRPVEYKNKKLVDGGMLNNIPIDVVLEMGAKKVIAVDLEETYPLYEEEKNIDLDYIIPKWAPVWLANWLANHPDINPRFNNWKKAKAIGGVIIHINFTHFNGNYNIQSFKDYKEIMSIGKSVLRQHIDEIKALKKK